MGHELIPGPRPEIMIIRAMGDVEYDDMVISDELGLNKGRQVYVLIDTRELSLSMPENFIEGARNSYYTHENLKHAAVLTSSVLVSTLVKMVAKLTRNKDKLSIHTDYDAAIAHLERLVAQAETAV
jgi:hypothetical protein